MKEIYLLVIEDRHEDTQIFAYTTYEQAEQNFNEYIERSPRVDKDEIEECAVDFQPDPLVFLKYAAYNEEGDCVYIIKKTVNEDLYED